MPPPEVKSPSLRLREMLFALYKQKKFDVVEDFETFYARQMEKIINHVKEKIHE